jgi:hypothetical protein
MQVAGRELAEPRPDIARAQDAQRPGAYHIRCGPRPLTCAPTATRTRDLLLRRHSRNVVPYGPAWPDVPFGYSENGWMWPGVALRLWSLAPSLAPRNIVSSANVRMRQADTGPGRESDQGTSAGSAGPPPRPTTAPAAQTSGPARTRHHAARAVAGRPDQLTPITKLAVATATAALRRRGLDPRSPAGG